MWAGFGSPTLASPGSGERRGRKSLLVLSWLFCKLQPSPWGRKCGQCGRESYKYRALGSLFKNAGEYICKLKSFTKKSAGLIDTSNAGIGMMMIIIVMAINNNRYHLLNGYRSVTILPTVTRTLLSTFGELFNSVSLWSVCSYLSLILKKRQDLRSHLHRAPFAVVPCPLSSLLPRETNPQRKKCPCLHSFPCAS